MKTMKILTAGLLIGIAFGAFATEKPNRKNIDAPVFIWGSPAEVAAVMAVAAKTADEFKFKNPHEIVEEGLKDGAFTLGFPELRFEEPEDITVDEIDKPAATIFRNPEAIVEEGLKEGAFAIGYPEMVWGSPEEISFESAVGHRNTSAFRNPGAITENGLSEKVFEIGFPKFVWGDPADIDIKAIEKLIAPQK